MLRSLCLCAWLALPSVVSACLVCDTELGTQVRGGIFAGHFGSTAVAVFLPFPALLLAVGLVHFTARKVMTERPQPTAKPKT